MPEILIGRILIQEPICRSGKHCSTFISRVEMHSSLPFDEWKELQINATAEKLRKAKEEQSGDIGLRLYGLSYRLTLE